MKVGEIRTMSDAAVAAAIVEKQKKVLETRCAVAMGDSVNPAELKKIQREIARLKTVKREKELKSEAGK